MVMELVPFCLGNLLTKARPDFIGWHVNFRDQPAYQLFFFKQLLKIIHHVHTKHATISWAHRDIKPMNILVDSRGYPKLIDWGIACPLTTTRNTPNFMSVWYCAPEVIHGGVYSHNVDIWSLGCVFAEILLGRPIFPVQDYDTLFQKIANASETPLPFERAPQPEDGKQRSIRTMLEEAKIDPGIVNLVTKMLEPDPTKRPSAGMLLTESCMVQAPLVPPRGFKIDPFFGSYSPFAPVRREVHHHHRHHPYQQQPRGERRSSSSSSSSRDRDRGSQPRHHRGYHHHH